ncbi:MAG: cation transporter [Janthinobacterium lividum]
MPSPDDAPSSATASLGRTARVVVALNLCGFAAECAVALHAGSVSLFADSVDFLEDASIGLLLLLALPWPPRRRAAVGSAMAGVLLLPACATLWTAAGRLAAPLAPPWLPAAATPPAPLPLALAGAGALAVNLACAALLARHRAHGGSLARAAFLSARNDVAGNLAVVAAGALTAAWPSAWPDLAVGLGIAALNAGAAREVWAAARTERKQA